MVVAIAVAAWLGGCGDDQGEGGGGSAQTSVSTVGSNGSTSSSSGSGGGDEGTLVMTDTGPVQGTIAGESRVFLGIPYAEPPVGDLRWRPPAPPTPWTDPILATTLGPKCAQLGAIDPTFDATSDEDCLTLNVWAPRVPPSDPAPVLVWIHGGTFIIGSGGEASYDGQRLAEATGSVVVTINYRLGPMGFLAHPALAAEDASHPASGMYGIEDQRAALTWVQNNAAAFGGDPENVTIFGESAGAIGVCMHLVSPPSAGLFHRAILESGTCGVGVTPPRAAAEARGASLVTALGCDVADPMACMRAKTTEEVLTAQPVSAVAIFDPNRWSPHLDGIVLPGDPLDLVEAGSFEDVPVLLGSNADEGTLFFAFGSPVTDEASYLALAEALNPGNGAAIVAQYPSATFGSPQAAATAVIGDAAFVCSARRLARALSAQGAPTWLYHFTRAPDALIPGLGAYHSAEIAFVFGNPLALSPSSPTAAEEPLVASMQGYWGRMARTGDPNGAGAFAWPPYDAVTDENIVLDLDVSSQAGLEQPACDFWDSLVP
jgi:para-nitrobenzyl esterase